MLYGGQWACTHHHSFVHPLMIFFFRNPKLSFFELLCSLLNFNGVESRGGRITLNTCFFAMVFCWTKQSALFLLLIKQHKKRDVSKPAAWIAPKVVLAVCRAGLGDRQGFVTKVCRHPQYNRLKTIVIYS